MLGIADRWRRVIRQIGYLALGVESAQPRADPSPDPDDDDTAVDSSGRHVPGRK